MSTEVTPEKAKGFPCPQCGAQLSFNPAQAMLCCDHCGYASAVPVSAEAIREYDLDAALREATAKPPETGYGGEKRSIKCKGCGAVNTVDATVVSTACPFCGSNQVVPQEQVAQVIKPESLIPFKVDHADAAKKFQKWLGTGFFRPNPVKKIARDVQAQIQGVYLPFWTFDAFTSSWWQAEAGHYYYTTESYWTNNDKGQRVQATRQVQHIRWEPASGHLQLPFDDVLVPAAKGVDAAMIERIYPFDTQTLVGYKPEFLAGWNAEAYTVDLKSGWTKGQDLIKGQVQAACAQQVPGDTYRNLRVDTAFSKMSYKHVLFPVWLASYRYNNKVYQFLVNGQTGEVQGEAPVSWIKVAFVVLVALIIIALIVWLMSMSGGDTSTELGMLLGMMRFLVGPGG